MFDFLKDKNANKIKRKFSLIEVACLLIHASKIDQNYTEKEKEIIKKTLSKLDTNSNEIEKIIEEAEKIENDSNQILDFTKNLKNVEEEIKGIGIKLIKRSIEEATREYTNKKIKISAQEYLKKFYTKLGFKYTGKSYLEDGIPHIEMISI